MRTATSRPSDHNWRATPNTRSPACDHRKPDNISSAGHVYQRRQNRMKQLLIFLALNAWTFSGCSKREASSTASGPQPTPEQAAQIESQYVLPPNTGLSGSPANSAPTRQRDPNAPAAARPIQERLQGAIHARLTVQLRMFIEKNGRVPDSFSEFANAAMDSAPLAPDGMKFVIDPTDRTVKAVKK